MKLEFAWLYLLGILSFVCVTILVHCLLEAKVLVIIALANLELLLIFGS